MKVKRLFVEVTFEGDLSFQVEPERTLLFDPNNILRSASPPDADAIEYALRRVLSMATERVTDFAGQVVRERAEANLRRPGPLPGNQT